MLNIGYQMLKVKCQRSNVEKGFTLIEVVVAMAIFLVIMVAVSLVFARFFGTYGDTRVIQQGLEETQFAMNSMAKTLRASSVHIPNSSSTSNSISVYNYSQQKCFRYYFDNGGSRQIQVGEKNTDPDNPDCTGNYTMHDMTTIGNIQGTFYVNPSSVGTVGKVTISIRIDKPGGGYSFIQSTVSLRDYIEAGI